MQQNAVKWRLALAAISAVIAVLFGVLGSVVSVVAFGVALPFAIAAVILWRQANDRLSGVHRHRRTADSLNRGGQGTSNSHEERYRRHRRERGEGGQSPAPQVSPAEARSVLEIPPDADEVTIRQAYRRRIKEVHPDQGGEEEEFRRVTAAYERLRDRDGNDRL